MKARLEWSVIYLAAVLVLCFVSHGCSDVVVSNTPRPRQAEMITLTTHALGFGDARIPPIMWVGEEFTDDGVLGADALGNTTIDDGRAEAIRIIWPTGAVRITDAGDERGSWLVHEIWHCLHPRPVGDGSHFDPWHPPELWQDVLRVTVGLKERGL